MNFDAKKASFEEVYNQYQGLVNLMASNLKIPGYDFDDLRQEMSIELYYSWQRYKPETGVLFLTYAWANMENHKKELLRAASQAKRRADKTAVSLNTMTCDEDCTLQDYLAQPGDSLDDLVFVSEVVDEIRKEAAKANPTARPIIQDMLTGMYTQIEICKRRHCSQSLVSYHWNNFLDRLRKRLREKGFFDTEQI